MSPLDRLVSALEARGLSVRGDQGRGFVAQCPAHDDRNASLSLSVANDGKALVRCHAGCETETVVNILGLELRDLFPGHDEEPPRKQRKQPAPLPSEDQLVQWSQ